MIEDEFYPKKKRHVCINHCNPIKLNMMQIKKTLIVLPLHRTERIIFPNLSINFRESC